MNRRFVAFESIFWPMHVTYGSVGGTPTDALASETLEINGLMRSIYGLVVQRWINWLVVAPLQHCWQNTFDLQNLWYIKIATIQFYLHVTIAVFWKRKTKLCGSQTTTGVFVWWMLSTCRKPSEAYYLASLLPHLLNTAPSCLKQ